MAGGAGGDWGGGGGVVTTDHVEYIDVLQLLEVVAMFVGGNKKKT